MSGLRHPHRCRSHPPAAYPGAPPRYARRAVRFPLPRRGTTRPSSGRTRSLSTSLPAPGCRNRRAAARFSPGVSCRVSAGGWRHPAWRSP
ncbi:hypothetical protein JCM10003_642 [Bacteroides pyogenes JCM 10003]|nr:hypothetical protein JCM10003_642 [Bacteroides pyogenes JCM 10003]